MIKYLYNEKGNKTDVLIPIEQWTILNNDELKHNFNEPDKLPSTFLMKHHLEILELIEKHKTMTKDEWINLYNEYFKYYNALDEYDINLLFFFRKSVNSLFVLSDDIQNIIDILYEIYKLTKLDGSKLSVDDYILLRNNTMYLNEFAYLQYFKLNFKVILPKHKAKRLQRLPDRNRLFIYDLLFINEVLSNDTMYENYFEFIQSKRNIIDFISTYLYNGVDSQVYRLQQETSERLNMLI